MGETELFRTGSAQGIFHGHSTPINRCLPRLADRGASFTRMRRLFRRSPYYHPRLVKCRLAALNDAEMNILERQNDLAAHNKWLHSELFCFFADASERERMNT